MSPALFNSIIDYVPGNINLQGNSIISYKAFADYLVLFAKDDVMVKIKLIMFYLY